MSKLSKKREILKDIISTSTMKKGKGGPGVTSFKTLGSAKKHTGNSEATRSEDLIKKLSFTSK